MSDFGGEVMAEVLAEQALVRPQIIPLVPLTNQYRHQDHIDHKDYKSKVSVRRGPGSSLQCTAASSRLCNRKWPLKLIFLSSFSRTSWRFPGRRGNMRRSRRYCLSHQEPPTIKGPPSSMPRTSTSMTSPAQTTSPFPRYLHITRYQHSRLHGAS